MHVHAKIAIVNKIRPNSKSPAVRRDLLCLPVGSILHLPAEKTCGGEDKLAFCLAVGTGGARRVRFVGNRCNATDDVAGANDGHRIANGSTAAVCKHGDRIAVASVGIERARIGDLLQLVRDCAIKMLLFGYARAGNDGVAVTDDNVQIAYLVQRFRILRGKGCKLPNGGILLENDLALSIGINFQGVSFTDNIDTDRSLLFSYAGAVEKGWDES